MDAEREAMIRSLLEAPAISEPERELRAWIKQCRATLEGRSSIEVAHMAILCGFDRDLVYSVISYFRDAMDGTHIESRLKLEALRWECMIIQVDEMRRALKPRTPRDIFIAPLWRELVDNTITGQEGL